MSKYISEDSMTSFAIHGNVDTHPQNAHVMPIFASTTFTFDSAAQGTAIFAGQEPGYTYSRFGNPTVHAAEEMIAGLEAFGVTNSDGSVLQTKALLHASGQSALATLLLSTLSAGDVLLSHPSLYGGTYEFFDKLLARMNIRVVFTDFVDMQEVEEIIKSTPKLKLIHLETPANPLLACFDISAISSLAAKYNVKVSVDNTFATPFLQQPFKYGADFIVHSTTKFLNGHGTAIGGVLIGKDVACMKGQVYDTYKLLGGCASPFDVYLLMQGIKTLGLRMERHCSNTEKIADYLWKHPAVGQVFYNGLKEHPGYIITQKQMRHAGAVMSFELKGGMTAAKKLMDNLRLCTRAVSLGTVDTLISHPASMSHVGVAKEKRKAAGLTDGLVRMSVGLEAVDDIINDLEQALEVN